MHTQWRFDGYPLSIARAPAGILRQINVPLAVARRTCASVGRRARNCRYTVKWKIYLVENTRYIHLVLNEKCSNAVYLPGPLAPPDIKRPRRNITALSYSCTTCVNKKLINVHWTRAVNSNQPSGTRPTCTRVHWLWNRRITRTETSRRPRPTHIPSETYRTSPDRSARCLRL